MAIRFLNSGRIPLLSPFGWVFVLELRKQNGPQLSDFHLSRHQLLSLVSGCETTFPEAEQNFCQFRHQLLRLVPECFAISATPNEIFCQFATEFVKTPFLALCSKRYFAERNSCRNQLCIPVFATTNKLFCQLSQELSIEFVKTAFRPCVLFCEFARLFLRREFRHQLLSLASENFAVLTMAHNFFCHFGWQLSIEFMSPFPSLNMSWFSEVGQTHES